MRVVCSLLVALCCLLCAVWCEFVVARFLLLDAYCGLYGVGYVMFVRLLSSVGYCLSVGVRCLMPVDCRVLCDV